MHEDMILVGYQAEYGNEWDKYQQHLPGRSENSIQRRLRDLKRMAHEDRVRTEEIGEEEMRRERQEARFWDLVMQDVVMEEILEELRQWDELLHAWPEDEGQGS
jgi:uncharacterized FAD-dependent dehydrogenase